MTESDASAGNRLATGRARLVDVARLAGVSKAAASKVLNGNPDFSARPETRRRVLQAAQELSYRPHLAARTLATARARTIALLVPQLTNFTHVTIARGVYQRATERGYVSVFSEDFDEQSAMAAFGELVGAGRVDGLIIASARPNHQLLESLRGSAVPHVFLNRAVPGSHRNVVMDVAQSSRLALQHFATLGHRVVAHLAGPEGIAPSDQRASAFKQLAPQFGITVRSTAHVAFSEHGGAQGTASVLGTGDVTGIYASSLAQAIGVLHGVRQLGLNVPEDVSVIGNDDFPIAGYLSPPLTTVAMPLRELGQYGADAIIDLLEGKAPTDIVIPTTPYLVVRDSTAAPHGGRGAAMPDRHRPEPEHSAHHHGP
jgi:LacI family transcriptional regulator